MPKYRVSLYIDVETVTEMDDMSYEGGIEGFQKLIETLPAGGPESNPDKFHIELFLNRLIEPATSIPDLEAWA